MIKDSNRRLFASGYLLAAMMVAIPLMELVANAFPLMPSAIRWRFGAVGYLGNNLVIPMVGFGFAAITAAVLGHRLVLRLLAVAGVIGSVLLLVLGGALVLDSLELRHTVPDGMQKSFDIAAGKALLSLIFGSGIALWLGIGGWRASAATRMKDRKASEAHAIAVGRIVVGSRTPSAAPPPPPSSTTPAV